MTAAAAVMPGSSSGRLTCHSVKRSETTVFYQFLTIDLLLLIVDVNIVSHSGYDCRKSFHTLRFGKTIGTIVNLNIMH